MHLPWLSCFSVCLLVLFISLLPSHSIAESRYVRISEFTHLFPKQLPVMERFAETVRSVAHPISKQQQHPARIAIIYPGVQNSDYWRRSLKALTGRLNDLNIRYETNIFLSRPSIDKELQAEQLAEALAWQPDYLIFNSDALSHRNTIQRILLQRKPKLILQNITTPVRTWLKYPPFIYTGFDHAYGTNLLAERMIASGAHKYGLLYFSPGYVSQMRGDTFAAAAQNTPSLSQAASFYTGGNRGKARAATEKLLRDNPDLDMIFACSTDIALGAIEALDQAGRHEKITVNGWGGGAAELNALSRGKLDLTVMRMNDDASVAIAEAIKLDIEGRSSQVPKVYSGDIILIDRNTTEEEITQIKQRAFRYSGQEQLH